MTDLRAKLEALRDDLRVAIDHAPPAQQALPKMVEEQVAAILAQLPASPGLPWVSVDERLPKPDEECLLLEGGKHESIGYREHTGDWVESSEDRLIHNVTHYVPLSAIPLPGAGEWIEAGEVHVEQEMVYGEPAGTSIWDGVLCRGVETPSGTYRVLLQRIEEGG